MINYFNASKDICNMIKDCFVERNVLWCHKQLEKNKIRKKQQPCVLYIYMCIINTISHKFYLEKSILVEMNFKTLRKVKNKIFLDES